MTFTTSGPGPICCKYTKAAKDVVVRIQFEKTQVSPINSGFFGGIKKSLKCGSSADNMDAESVSIFRSQFESTKEDARRSLTLTLLSPVANRTRLRAPMFALEDPRENLWGESIKEEEED